MERDEHELRLLVARFADVPVPPPLWDVSFESGPQPSGNRLRWRVPRCAPAGFRLISRIQAFGPTRFNADPRASPSIQPNPKPARAGASEGDRTGIEPARCFPKVHAQRFIVAINRSRRVGSRCQGV
jgi:hypothetical protein